MEIDSEVKVPKPSVADSTFNENKVNPFIKSAHRGKKKKH